MLTNEILEKLSRTASEHDNHKHDKNGVCIK
jgi:hypothetical protein